ncbi:anti-sigma regulatory factor [Maridesulfovibrio sp.]|uniref:anti-sigma regulatory factor n=1 Tax=unclassified Maridesulfovibrio TaxID=2794999 RepID=UPI003AFFFFDC
MSEFLYSQESIVELIDISDAGIALGVARCMAADAGFGEKEQYLIATAVSELATNVVRYAGNGIMVLRIIHDGDKVGLEVVAKDSGPGIADVDLAMQENYSTSGSLGLGLPGVERLMDEFHLDSAVGQGTTCTARKWRG